MKVKRIIGLLLVSGALLLTAACDDQLRQQVDDLKARAAKLQELCDEINANIQGIRTLVSAIEEKDMITGITEIKEGSVVKGYTINFVHHDPVTILNGQDGKTPLVASKQDSDGNYYWTIQYGSDPAQWILDPDGNKMLSVGTIPYLTIRNGMWCYTEDMKTYIEIGPATGEDGEKLFKSVTVDASDPRIVVITLSNGQVLRVPTYNAYIALKEEFDKINSNVDAQTKIIKAALDKMIYIAELRSILDGTDTVGTHVTFSNGSDFSLYDWTDPMIPVIFVKEDTDGELYWAYAYPGQDTCWVLTPDGKKIQASSQKIEAPVVDVQMADDGYYYWVVKYQDTTVVLRYQLGANYEPHARDSAANNIYKTLTEDEWYVYITLKNGQQYTFPKQYTVSLISQDGMPVDDALSMRAGSETLVRYMAFGPSPGLTLIAQGGVSAIDTTINDETYIRIKAPSASSFNQCGVVAIFTFGEDSSPVSVIRSFAINKKED